MANQSEDLYGDGDTMTAEAPASKAGDAGEEPTFLVSKSAFMGHVPKVGETKEVRVTRDLGDQVECQCEYPDKESADEDKGENETDSAPSGMNMGPGTDSDYE